MKVDIKIVGKIVDLVIEVIAPDTRAFLALRLPLLETALRQLGYQDINVSCTVVADLVTHRRERRAVDALA